MAGKGHADDGMPMPAINAHVHARHAKFKLRLAGHARLSCPYEKSRSQLATSAVLTTCRTSAFHILKSPGKLDYHPGFAARSFGGMYDLHGYTIEGTMLIPAPCPPQAPAGSRRMMRAIVPQRIRCCTRTV